MLRKLSVFFLHHYKFRNAVFFSRRHIAPEDLYPIFFNEANLDKEKSFHVLCSGIIFVKTTFLKKLAVRFRVSLMLSRGGKGYDYPLADLINSINVEVSGASTPKLIGFGYQSSWGLVNKISLIYENLNKYTDGEKWLFENPERAIFLTKKVHAKIIRLHSLRCYHLDIWLGNVMVPEDGSSDIYLIDFEQYVSGVAADIESLLGFMFGYFYSRGLTALVEEIDYDNLTFSALSGVCDFRSKAFQEVYRLSKKGKVNRKMRRQFFTTQKVPSVI